MASINKGRYSADTGADGAVLFLIGMRISQTAPQRLTGDQNDTPPVEPY